MQILPSSRRRQEAASTRQRAALSSGRSSRSLAAKTSSWEHTLVCRASSPTTVKDDLRFTSDLRSRTSLCLVFRSVRHSLDYCNAILVRMWWLVDCCNAVLQACCCLAMYKRHILSSVKCSGRQACCWTSADADRLAAGTVLRLCCLGHCSRLHILQILKIIENSQIFNNCNTRTKL